VSTAVQTQAIPRGLARSRHTPVARYDWWLIAAAAALLLLGLVMVTSASIAIADRELGQPLYYLWRQGLYLVTGLVLAAGAARIPLSFWRLSGPVLLVAGVLLLALVLVPGVGHEVNGSMRWMRVGPFNLQPSELVKLFTAIYLSGYLVRHSAEVRGSVSGFLKPMAVLTLIAGLLLQEPDFGAIVVLFATVLGMLFLAGVPLGRFLWWVAAAGVVMAAILWMEPYRVERLMTFRDPWADPFASGFQLTQALIAIGRGEWFGVGLGSSIQKLFYLPEAHTDFLFAVLAEELGFLGMLVVIGLFGFLVWRAFRIAHRAERQGRLYGAYLAYGLGLGIGLQAFINIGVNLGVLPTKGLTLPFMSYGGSSMVANCVAMGLLVRIDHELRTGEGKA